MYSVMVAGACGEPSVVPCCGIPLNRAATSAAPGSASVSEPTAGALLATGLEPRVKAIARPTATPTATTAAATPSSTRGDARRGGRFGPTGAGGAGVRRFCLLLLPLGI